MLWVPSLLLPLPWHTALFLRVLKKQTKLYLLLLPACEEREREKKGENAREKQESNKNGAFYKMHRFGPPNHLITQKPITSLAYSLANSVCAQLFAVHLCRRVITNRVRLQANLGLASKRITLV